MKVFIGSHLLESVALMPPRSLSLGLLTQLLLPPLSLTTASSQATRRARSRAFFLKLYLWF